MKDILDKVDPHLVNFITCTPLDKTFIKYFCKDCDTYLFNDNDHSDHHLITLDDINILFCLEHKVEFSYYCKTCLEFFCIHEINKHKEHNIEKLKIIEGNFNLKNFENFLEAAEKIKKEKYYLLKDILLFLSKKNQIQENKSNHMNELIKEFQNDFLNQQNMIFLAKILFTTYYKVYFSNICSKNNNLNKNEKQITEKYKDILNNIINLFNQEEVKKFQKLITSIKNNYIANKKLTEKEEIKLNNCILNIFEPMNNNISFVKTKKFIENNIEYSSILKKYAEIEYKKNPNDYIDIDSTINNIEKITKNLNSNENSDFVLSIIGKCLENNGTKVYISKQKNNKFKNIEFASIQSIFSLGTHKKYEIHFDFGEELNAKILNDQIIQEKFISIYSNKISKFLNTDIDNLILTDLNPGSVKAHLSIINPTKEMEKNICKLEGKENIKKIKVRPLIECLQISREILDLKGDRSSGWGENEKRGNEKYIPPLNGWTGIGLKVLNMYDNGNNVWIDYKNLNGEFAIAYIGINNFLNDKDRMIKDLNDYARNIQKMINNKLYQTEIDIRSKNNQICGEGICLFQNPQYAENSAGIIDIFGFRIKLILMCRVNPKKIRQPKNFPECWILNPTPDEIRPYRILIKKIPISPLVGTANDKIITIPQPMNYIISAINSKDFSFLGLKNDIRFNVISEIDGIKCSNEIFAIRLYSSIYYGFINEYLRSGKVLDDFYGRNGFTKNQLDSWVCCLQYSIFNIKNVADNTIVYRGIKNFKFSQEIGIGSKFYFREFLSTSINRNFSESWINNRGTLMIITIKNNGTNGHINYCCYIEEFSISKGQEEVLFASHCYFIITKIIRDNNMDYAFLTCIGYPLNKFI